MSQIEIALVAVSGPVPNAALDRILLPNSNYVIPVTLSLTLINLDHLEMHR